MKDKEKWKETLELLRETFPGKLALSVKEASMVMGINPGTLYEAIRNKTKTFPYQKVTEKKIIIPMVGLAKWLSAREEGEVTRVVYI
jgi:hypothetical protein